VDGVAGGENFTCAGTIRKMNWAATINKIYLMMQFFDYASKIIFFRGKYESYNRLQICRNRLRK
jgi:hypothetical protein